jgi:transposase
VAWRLGDLRRAFALNRPGIDGGSQSPKDEGHVRTEEVPRGGRERAIRLVRDLVDDSDGAITVTGACRRVGEQLGINTDTLRNWVKDARVDAGQEPGVTTTERARIAALEREVRELRRANAILKTASAFFAAELDRPQPRPLGRAPIRPPRAPAVGDGVEPGTDRPAVAGRLPRR